LVLPEAKPSVNELLQQFKDLNYQVREGKTLAERTQAAEDMRPVRRQLYQLGVENADETVREMRTAEMTEAAKDDEAVDLRKEHDRLMDKRLKLGDAAQLGGSKAMRGTRAAERGHVDDRIAGILERMKVLGRSLDVSEPALVLPIEKTEPAPEPVKPSRSYREIAESKLEAPPEGKGLVDVTDDDIPWQTAQQAHEGTSMVPEDRAARVRRDFVNTIRAAESRLAKYATTPEKKAEAQGMLERYKAGYRQRLLSYLGSQSGFYSSMISGRSGYPAARMEKKQRSIDKRRTELLEWGERTLDKMDREISERGPVKATDPQGVDKLQDQIDDLVKQQKTMKAANKIVRKKGLSKEQKIEQLQAMGFKKHAARLLEPDFAGRLGFPGYELTSVNEKVKRLKARQELITREQSHETAEHTFDGGTVVDNAEDDRVQIYFDSKPDVAMRSKLKGRGFRWAPSIGVWQRQRTDAARFAVKEVLGLELPMPERTEKSLYPGGRANLDMAGWLTHHAGDSSL